MPLLNYLRASKPVTDGDDKYESASEDEAAGVAAADPTPESEQVVSVNIKEPIQWVERMTLSAVRPLPADLNPDDDPRREQVFMKHALVSVEKGITMLEKAGIPWKRKDDYFAEMYKSDIHMAKIRQSIEATKAAVQRQVQAHSRKEQRQFGKEVQAEALRQKAKHKRDALDQVKKWQTTKGARGEQEAPNFDDDAASRKKRFAGKKSLNPGGAKKAKARPGKSKRH